jgi:tRNA G10  N-methylase Trm11
MPVASWFGQRSEYFNMRFLELFSLLGIEEGVESALNSNPYFILPVDINVDREKLVSVTREAVLTKAFVEIFAESNGSLEELIETVKQRCIGQVQFLLKDKTFCFEIMAFGKKLSHTEQTRRMNMFSFLFQGDEKAEMKNPDVIIWITETGPSHWMFGIQIAPIRRLCHTENPRLPMSLSNRPVLGPTTLDNDLAFLMCNVLFGLSSTQNQLILDPFCGSAGLLVTAASKSAKIFGCDADFRVLQGYSCTYSKLGQSRTDIFMNFEHYGFLKPEILSMDIFNPSWNQELFDGIITDTPYGVRAAINGDDILTQLIDVAAKILKPGKPLVFLMHCELIDLLDSQEEIDQIAKNHKHTFVKHRPVDNKLSLYVSETSRIPELLDQRRYLKLIPSHEKFRVIGTGLQILTAGYGRLLVKMIKI